MDALSLQLGAGLGLCGILAKHMNASTVILTDGDTDTLANLRLNVNRNCVASLEGCSAIECKQLIWGQNVDQFIQKSGGSFDTILGSDVTYAEDAIEPLFQTVEQLLPADRNRGHFLLAYTHRNVSIESILEIAKRSGFRWNPPNTVEGVYVFFRKNCTKRETEDKRIWSFT